MLYPECNRFYRLIISRLPFKIKIFFTNLIAYVIYFPWIKFLKFLKYINIKINNLPLSFYIDKSIYIIKNDSLDRFATPLEKRFSKKQIENLMSESGLENINFHNKDQAQLIGNKGRMLLTKKAAKSLLYTLSKEWGRSISGI